MRQRPEWRGWLGMLREVAQELNDPCWRVRLDEAAPQGESGDSSEDVPVLHRRSLAVDRGRLKRLVSRLASAAGGSLRRYAPPATESVALLEMAIRHDSAGLAAISAAAGVDQGALSSVAYLAAFPLLQCCGQELQARVPRSWRHGYCPVCAAWPILAELRGLDRGRRLRCGRCAGEWEVQWLRCAYCGEQDHRRLGSLVPEDGGEILKVETCDTCRGYLKSVATLQRIPGFELLLRDLETVELDLVAVDRNYGRPEASGFALEVRLR